MALTMFRAGGPVAVTDRFTSLRVEVERLQKLVDQREAERKAVEEEATLLATIAELRRQLGII